MEQQVTLNAKQGLYIIPAGKDAYSCLGFDVVMEKIRRGYAELGEGTPSVRRGTMTAYVAYLALITRLRTRYDKTGKRAEYELTPQLIGLEGARVEVEDSSGDVRRFIVGKSTGWIPCHLEIPKRNSSGGPAVYGAPFKRVTVIGRNDRHQ